MYAALDCTAAVPWPMRALFGSVMQSSDLPQQCGQMLPAYPVFDQSLSVSGGSSIHHSGIATQKHTPREEPVRTKKVGSTKAKSRRSRRGGRAEKREMRLDPSDGKMRTWEGFMMRHAQGASFDEADRLWEEAAPPQPAEAEADSDTPPELLEAPESPMSVKDNFKDGFKDHIPLHSVKDDFPPKESKRVRFVMDSSVETHFDASGSDWHFSEESRTPPPSISPIAEGPLSFFLPPVLSERLLRITPPPPERVTPPPPVA